MIKMEGSRFRMEPVKDLSLRTKRYALAIIRFCGMLPRNEEGNIIRRQLLRSGTSVGAHYREAFRARSGPEFISKMEGGIAELDETSYWLELLTESNLALSACTADLMRETDELLRIFVASVKTAKSNL
jgi:four helix bundle protein